VEAAGTTHRVTTHTESRTVWRDVTPTNGLLFRMRIIENILLGAFLVIMPVTLAAVTYALGWFVLCFVRFIPLIGRKHRHADWDRLNK
jgi:hypothetical protein